MRSIVNTMVNQSDLIHPVPAIAPVAARTTNTAIVSSIIDTLGFDSCTFLIQTGTNTDSDVTFAVTMEHGDNSALSDTAAPAAADLVGGAAALTNAAFNFGDDNECRKVGYIGAKRYVRLTITPTGNDAGNIFLAAIALLGNPASPPTPNPPQ